MRPSIRRAIRKLKRLEKAVRAQHPDLMGQMDWLKQRTLLLDLLKRNRVLWRKLGKAVAKLDRISGRDDPRRSDSSLP
jgi:hypothetical protein